MFDYSCCTFCPYDDDQCPGCKAKDAERRLNRIMAGRPEEDYDPWDDNTDDVVDCPSVLCVECSRDSCFGCSGLYPSYGAEWGLD